MAIVVVLAGSWIGYQRLSDSGCSGKVTLTVAAATELAPAVDQAAQQWVADGADVEGTCVAVTVTGVSPATMAAAVARQHNVTLSGASIVSKSVQPPDVWIPDSSTWLLRLKSEASGFVPTDGKSVALSPVVVAMPAPIAETIGWPNKKLGWKDLLAKMDSSTAIKTGIVDPNKDAAGLSGLLALAQAAGTGVQAQQAKVGALRALAQNSSSLRDDLLQKFPRSGDPTELATGLSAAPLSEEDVIAYNADQPKVPLAALYLDPTPPPLNYPFAVLPGVDLQHQAAATGLHQALSKPAFKNALGAAGLRAPDGTVGSGFAAPVGAQVPSAPAVAPTADPAAASGGAAASSLDASVISQALGGWAATTLPGRVLAVFDISGSMNEPVPTARGLSRAAVTRGAAAGGLALFDDRWAVGVWLFSTELDGKKPYKQVVKISPLSSSRTELQASVGQIVPKKNGGTGLYNTALAAYKSVYDSWQPGVINSVILFTDGENQDKNSISQGTLVAQLKKLNDPKKPVRLVIVGIGPDVNRAELQTITNATPAGGVFVAPDPAKISDIFLEAIATRSGAS
jgi:hypothetical protein